MFHMADIFFFFSSVVSDEDDDDDDEDDTEALMAELEQIRKERAEEKLRKVSFSQYALFGALLSFLLLFIFQFQ